MSAEGAPRRGPNAGPNVARGHADWLPLPLPVRLSDDVVQGVPRTKRRALLRRARETTAAVNWMHDSQSLPTRPDLSQASRGRVGELQGEAARRVELAVSSWGEPGSAATTQSAWEELMRGRGSYGVVAQATLAPFSNGRPSVPDDVSGAPFLAEVSGDAEVEMMEA